MDIKKVHIGCGKRKWVGWYNVDMADFKHIHSKDISLQNIKNNTLDLIYCSHFLEYFDMEDCITLLRYWRRKLKETGKLYIAVPDFDKISYLYLKCSLPIASIQGPIMGIMKIGKEIIQHKTIFNESRLSDLLQLVGFKQIEKYTPETLIGNKDDHSKAELCDERISLCLRCTKC